MAQQQKESEYFKQAQLLEKENIKQLFVEYWKNHNCSNLIFTDKEEYSLFDALMISGSSTGIQKNIIIEHKRRNITLPSQYDNCIIEFPKFEGLHKFHLAGSIVLYVVQYDNATAIWNLSDIYEIQKRIGLDYFFYPLKCTARMSNYFKGEKEKWVRDLKFNTAQLIDANFQPIQYMDFVNEMRNNLKREKEKNEQYEN